MIIRNKVRTDSSTKFGSNPILVHRIRIESAAGSKPILIVQIRTTVNHAVDFNERVTAFITGRACTPYIKGGYCLVPKTAPISSADATDTSRAQWLADPVIAWCPINGAGCRHTWLFDSRKQPMSAADCGVACTTPFVQCFTLLFANGRILSHGPWKVTVSIGSILNRRFRGGRFYWIGPI